MINDDFEFIIASPIERERLICEIYYKEEIIAEISQETSELMLEIYPSQINKWWKMPLIEFQNALEQAKKKLSGVND